MLISFYVPVLHRPGDLAVDKDDRSTGNLVGAKKLASRVVEDRLIFKVERKRASVDLRERISLHELEERRAGIGAEDVDLVARALVEPSLKDRGGHIPGRSTFGIQAKEEQDGAP
jgi:hypothetical protein